MLRKLSLLTALVLGVGLLSGCGPNEYVSKGSYFDGAVVVEYTQNRASGTMDYLTFRIYEKGIYEISFSPSKGAVNANKLPKNFTKIIEAAPREFVIEQYILPDYLRVTIKKDGSSEYHDFQ